MKKICFIVSTPYTAKAFLENHFKVLSQHYDVYLVANLEDEDFSEYSNEHLVELKNIQIHRKINVLADAKALRKLRSYLKQHSFDCIVTFTPKAGLIGILAGWLAGITHRIHFFTGQVWHTKKGFFKFFLKTLDTIVVHFSTAILVDGKPQQEFLIAHHILTQNNSKVIGKGTISGLDLSKFSVKPLSRERYRTELGYSDDDVVFMFLGRLNKDKGVFDLVEAFQRLNAKYLKTKLLFVGFDEEHIQEQVMKLQLPNVFFYGSTHQPEELLQCCDVFCLPSHREAFGLSVIEASACEKPILCSDTYGLRDTIVDQITGIRSVTGSPDSIFEGMEFLVTHPNQRIEMGKQGRKYVETYFSSEALTDLWLAYFKGSL